MFDYAPRCLATPTQSCESWDEYDVGTGLLASYKKLSSSSRMIGRLRNSGTTSGQARCPGLDSLGVVLGISRLEKDSGSMQVRPQPGATPPDKGLDGRASEWLDACKGPSNTSCCSTSGGGYPRTLKSKGALQSLPLQLRLNSV